MDTNDPFTANYPTPTATRPLLGLTVLVVEDSRYACEGDVVAMLALWRTDQARGLYPLCAPPFTSLPSHCGRCEYGSARREWCRSDC